MWADAPRSAWTRPVRWYAAGIAGYGLRSENPGGDTYRPVKVHAGGNGAFQHHTICVVDGYSGYTHLEIIGRRHRAHTARIRIRRPGQQAGPYSTGRCSCCCPRRKTARSGPGRERGHTAGALGADDVHTDAEGKRPQPGQDDAKGAVLDLTVDSIYMIRSSNEPLNIHMTPPIHASKGGKTARSATVGKRTKKDEAWPHKRAGRKLQKGQKSSRGI